MVKGKGKLDADGPSRERSITWDDDHTKFMLDWYIEYKKNQHAGFVWKKQHHLKCADALNKQFGMGVTLAQVDRHYRDYKEKWKIVEKALNKSGNGFDATRCKITVSESEKEKLNDRARRLLSKPIKFFHEMEELFLGSNADGSLAMDQETCLEDAKDSDSGDSGGINNTSCYANPVDLLDDDSDTLPSPKNLKLSPACAASGDNSSSSTLRSGMKRPRGVKSPKKKPQKPKSRFSEATEVISTTMQALVKSFAEPPPPPPLPKLDNPYANLWKRLEALPILRSEDKVNIGVYLARPDCEGMRSFLDASSDKTLETWVYQFLCEQGGH
ncbi:hypothetical protein ACP70R_027602 [Stipagrostis hirtigluma subsp. patula]